MTTISPSLRGSSLSASFAPFSSPVDWCEENGDLPLVEFYNTISNIGFVVLSFLSFIRMGPYFRCVDPCFFPFSCLLLSVGAFSGLFHATLSYAGQLLDEWSVLLINIYTLAVWCPDEWLRRGVTREKFTARMIGATILVMPLGFIVPTINAPLLLLFSIAHIMSIKQVMRGVRSCEIKRIGRAGITSFLFGFFCWINDRLLCDFGRRASKASASAIRSCTRFGTSASQRPPS